ncbi:MFS transporter [Caulobacter vibrioides]|uniref:MFS transporter n=1 Tax=Caulobacter vibrioides TaxID=155892 RepID=UPI000BB4A475|nr:MFS transporter [Caulobacter vibrioides]ATC24637.1 MFS transporter [Caulobacter vibrioides]AZH12775.1 MFS transporter [Caulobacter vibrioides]PLR09412.1 MFS transporter [Caulobacter vibrioides]
MGTSFRLFVMMVLQLAIWGAWAPKIFPYMGMLGFAPWQQSLVGSAWGVAALVGIFFSNQFADRNFSAERFLAVSHLIGGVALLGTAFSTTFWPFFACYLVFSLVYVPTLSVTNSIAFANLRDPAAGFGGVRMGGTVGWVLVSWPFVFLLGAQATVEQVRWIFLVAAIVSFVFAGYALTLPHTPPRKADDAVDKLAWRRAFKLLGAPFVFVLFVVTFIDSVIHNGYFVMADAFLTNRVGIAGNLSMVVLSLGQVAEIITMLLLGRVLAKLGWKVTMIVGVLGHAARFAVFAYFADSVPVIVAVQLLHGVCYAFFFATVYIFVDAVFPKDVRSSAQGLFNLLILGVGNVAASFIFPALIGRLTTDGSVDYTTLFLVPTAMALAAVCLLALFFRPPTRGPVSEADSASSAAGSAQA